MYSRPYSPALRPSIPPRERHVCGISHKPTPSTAPTSTLLLYPPRHPYLPHPPSPVGSADPFLQHPPIPFLHRTPTAPLAPTGSDRAPLPTRIPTLPPRPPAKLFPLRTWQSTPPAHRLSRRSSTAPAPLRLTIIQTSDEAHHQGPSLEHGSYIWLPYGIAFPRFATRDGGATLHN